MSIGKALNKNSYYAGTDLGAAPEVAMPSMNQQTPINQVANPWDNPAPQQQTASPMAAVPDYVPEEVEAEMQEESVETEQPLQDSNSPKQQKSLSAESNLRVLREARDAEKVRADKIERERDELMRMWQQAQTSNQPKKPEPIPEPDRYADIEDGSLIEARHVKQLSREMREMKAELNGYKQQSAKDIAEARLQAQYPDIEKVISPENIAALVKADPDLAEMIANTGDFYKQTAKAYKYIKQLGIYQDAQAAQPAPLNTDHLRALKNVAKPRPLASVNPQQGDSPLSKANAFANGEFTAEIREQSRKEMNQARKAM